MLEEQKQTIKNNDALVEIGGKEIEVVLNFSPPKFDVSDPAGVAYVIYLFHCY